MAGLHDADAPEFRPVLRAANHLMRLVRPLAKRKWPVRPGVADPDRHQRLNTLTWALQALFMSATTPPDDMDDEEIVVALAGTLGGILAQHAEASGGEGVEELMLAFNSQLGNALRQISDVLHPKGEA